MSELPGLMKSLGLLPELDGIVQVGRGVVGAVLGQTYEVRRLDGNTNGSITNNAPIVFSNGETQFPARLRRSVTKFSVENEIYSLLCFKSDCDNRELVLGDLLFENGYGAMEAGYYTYAQARPMRETLLMRSEFTASITRPYTEAGAADQQPAAGFVALDGYGGTYKQIEEVLVLLNGFYSFKSGDGVQPATVQVGMQPIRRLRDGHSLGTPTDMYRVEYLFYVPELPGDALNELDRINLGSADRYAISQVFSSEWTGLSGYVLVCEKLGV